MPRIRAAFQDAGDVREAMLKLQALRAQAIENDGDGMSLAFSVESETEELAMRLIRQAGGTPEL